MTFRTVYETETGSLTSEASSKRSQSSNGFHCCPLLVSVCGLTRTVQFICETESSRDLKQTIHLCQENRTFISTIKKNSAIGSSVARTHSKSTLTSTASSLHSTSVRLLLILTSVDLHLVPCNCVLSYQHLFEFKHSYISCTSWRFSASNCHFAHHMSRSKRGVSVYAPVFGKLENTYVHKTV
jgi:hypothetical protein